MAAEIPIALPEQLLLGLIAIEQPIHGFALAQLTAADAVVGRIYRVPRPIVYRSLDRLTQARLIRHNRKEASARGPQRTLLVTTSAGRTASSRWLLEPVQHVRDFRTALLCKLLLLDRAGQDPTLLLAAQRAVLAPIVAALADSLQENAGFERTLATWRYRTAVAALSTVDDLLATAPPGTRCTSPTNTAR